MHRKITGYRIFGVIFFSDVGYPVGQLSNRILNIFQDIRSDIWNKDSKKKQKRNNHNNFLYFLNMMKRKRGKIIM